MNLKDKFLYTNYKARLVDPILFFKKIFGYKSKNVLNNFQQFIDLGKDYKRIVVLASGPSASLMKYSPDNLYITTNSSYLMLPPNANFIHILNDFAYIKKFIVFGLKSKPKKVYIYLPFDKRFILNYKSMSNIKECLGKYPFDVEVISQTENLFNQKSKNIYNEFNYLNEKLAIKNPNLHSGLIMLNFALLLSSYHNLPISLYGLDAGEGGNKYFDGRKTLNNPVHAREKNKKLAGEFLEYLGKDFPLFENYSYFKGNQ